LRDDIKIGTVLGKAINKYGADNFTYEIIEFCDDSEMSNREIYYIKELNSHCSNKCGYNMTYGGETLYGESNPFYGKKHSDETRKIISDMASQRVGELNPFYGKHHTEENKIKASERNLGKKQSIETVEKRKRYGIDNHFYGKTHSIETRKKMSESHKGRITQSAIPYIAYNDSGILYFKSVGIIMKHLREYGYVDDSFTAEKLKTRLKNSEKKNELYCGYYWKKSVETIENRL